MPNPLRRALDHPLSNILRRAFNRAGYRVLNLDSMAFGIDPWIDVKRLDGAWGRSTSTIFDVGANIGQTVSKFLAEVPGARIFAFEPNPTTFALLAKANASNLTVSTHQIALGEASGKVVLFEYGSDGVFNSLVPDAQFAIRSGQKADERIIDSMTLDAFCLEQGVDRLDILKIDVEGFELSVLKGAVEMLTSRRIRYIYLEFNDLQPKLGTSGGALIPISDFLAKFHLRYVSTYTDFVLTDGEMFVCANALFALPPESEKLA